MALSPMMLQYLEIKRQHPDKIVFYRLGDFYEMFYEDAQLASRELELTLTGRDCGEEERAPMCGVPHHSSEAYIARLIEKGYKVAICEQMEEASAGKGPVRREITRVITPGTLLEGSMLDEGRNNYLCCIYAGEGGAVLLFADISTGEAALIPMGAGAEKAMLDELSHFSPREVLANSGGALYPAVTAFVTKRLGALYETVPEEYCQEGRELLAARPELLGALADCGEAALSATGMLLRYLEENHLGQVAGMLHLSVQRDNQFMLLDTAARRNLELSETIRAGERRGSLLWAIDRTKTAMGKRLIRAYLDQPLMSAGAISRRHQAVGELCGDTVARETLIESLGGIYDIERLIGRIVFGNATPRDVQALSFTAKKLPETRELLLPFQGKELAAIRADIDPLEDVTALIDRALGDDLPATLRDGGVIRAGYNDELDELRDVVSGGRALIAKIEAQERARTGIKNLKVGFNKVFGYYLEVTKSYIADVPPRYIRKQTLVNCERYITEELKNHEEKVLYARDKIIAIEGLLFDDLREQIAQERERIQKAAAALARLDVYCSFAAVSVKQGYCCPSISPAGEIDIKDGRHPVLEQMRGGELFVPNDSYLNRGDSRIALITGPNMAGKSTYMRQTALICLLMQIGCFVPAREARLPILDRLFVRVGAADDLSAGQSTFMVEMSEVAYMLDNATADSFVILDEIGRGTSTYDGMSIARAVLEHIADKKQLGAKAMFATHYHELTALEGQVDGVKNLNTAVKKRGDDIIFLRRIIPGGADESYGIEVAKLAGVKSSVIKRAKQILAEIEAAAGVPPAPSAAPLSDEGDMLQQGFGDRRGAELRERIQKLDLATLTPIEALNLLYSLQKELAN